MDNTSWYLGQRSDKTAASPTLTEMMVTNPWEWGESQNTIAKQRAALGGGLGGLAGGIAGGITAHRNPLLGAIGGLALGGGAGAAAGGLGGYLAGGMAEESRPWYG